ncbi:MAG: hypothetical protein DHS20C15_01440 [Planctomycetota bacterium]|nr:MAG: hypothetical protein DHS20C15_01440 [Planctomycetota bacterium]
MLENCSDVVSVHVTLPAEADADALAQQLVELRLAACVNVLPGVRSVYRWQAAVEQAAEHLLLIKTTRARLAALEAALIERHSDDVPCVLVQSVEAGHAPYLAWLRAQL